MAPHTITHCINDYTSFLRESRDIKYRILMNIKFCLLYTSDAADE